MSEAQRSLGVFKDSAVLDKKVTQALNQVALTLSNKAFGNNQKTHKVIQTLKDKGILKSKENSTLPGPLANPVNLSTQVNKLVQDPRFQKLTDNQKQALEDGLDKLRQKKILKDLPSDTIE